MAKKQNKSQRPSLDPTAREKQLINLAYNLAEQQMLDGTAKSSVIVHFLKMGTANAELEREKLIQDTELAKSKVKAIESDSEGNRLYEEAIRQFGIYSGTNEKDIY